MRTQKVTELRKPIPNPELRCVHALTGNAPGAKQCGNWFDCRTCEYDQMLHDTAETNVFNPEIVKIAKVA